MQQITEPSADLISAIVEGLRVTLKTEKQVEEFILHIKEEIGKNKDSELLATDKMQNLLNTLRSAEALQKEMYDRKIAMGMFGENVAHKNIEPPLPPSMNQGDLPFVEEDVGSKNKEQAQDGCCGGWISRFYSPRKSAETTPLLSEVGNSDSCVHDF